MMFMNPGDTSVNEVSSPVTKPSVELASSCASSCGSVADADTTDARHQETQTRAHARSRTRSNMCGSCPASFSSSKLCDSGTCGGRKGRMPSSFPNFSSASRARVAASSRQFSEEEWRDIGGLLSGVGVRDELPPLSAPQPGTTTGMTAVKRVPCASLERTVRRPPSAACAQRRREDNG
jgi:hypothetical protein